MTAPTDQDRRNAEMRQQVAAKQNAAYDEAQDLADATLGPGYSPWMKLSLLDSGYHQGGSHEPVAVAFKVYRGELKLSDNSVYLRELPDGTVKQADNYEELFGDLLKEAHPTRTLTLLGGQVVPAPRYSVTWSALERYEPRNAAQLAALRESRERKKAEREQQAYVREYPLFALIDEKEGRGR